MGMNFDLLSVPSLSKLSSKVIKMSSVQYLPSSCKEVPHTWLPESNFSPLQVHRDVYSFAFGPLVIIESSENWKWMKAESEWKEAMREGKNIDCRHTVLEM